MSAWSNKDMKYDFIVDGFHVAVNEDSQEILLEVSNLFSPTIMRVINSKTEFRKADETQIVYVDFDYDGESTNSNSNPINFKLNLPKEKGFKRIELRIKKSIHNANFAIVWPKPSEVTLKNRLSRMTDISVVKIANETIKKAGYRLEDYKKPKPRLEFVDKKHVWNVSYYGITSVPGNHLLVTVDDETGEVILQKGE